MAVYEKNFSHDSINTCIHINDEKNNKRSYVQFDFSPNDVDFRELYTDIVSYLVTKSIPFSTYDHINVKQLSFEDGSGIHLLFSPEKPRMTFYSDSKGRDSKFNMHNCLFVLNDFLPVLRQSRIMPHDLEDYLSSFDYNEFTGSNLKVNGNSVFLKRKPPKNYIMTEYGVMPNPELSDKVREIYSNYFRVMCETTAKELVDYGHAHNIDLWIRDEFDYENDTDLDVKNSEVVLTFSLLDTRNLDGLEDLIQKYSHEQGYHLEELSRKNSVRRYQLRDHNVELILRMYDLDEQDGPYLQVLFESMNPKASINDAVNSCFCAATVYRELFEDVLSVDWGSISDYMDDFSVNELRWDNFQLWEEPRTAWESTTKWLFRQKPDTLSELLFDCLYRYRDAKKENKSEEMLILKQNIDKISKVLEKKKKEFKREEIKKFFD